MSHFDDAVEAMGNCHAEMQQLCGHGASDKELLEAALPHIRRMLAEEIRTEADLNHGADWGWIQAADHLTRPEVMK